MSAIARVVTFPECSGRIRRRLGAFAVVLLLGLGGRPSSAQWVNDPSQYVQAIPPNCCYIWPSTLRAFPDSAGGVVVVDPPNSPHGPHSAVAQRVDRWGQRRWGTSGVTAIQSDSYWWGQGKGPFFCADGAGGAQMLWMGWHSQSAENYPLFDPRYLTLNAAGASPLGTNGPVAEVDSTHESTYLGPGGVVPDGAGGAFVTWFDVWDDTLGTHHAGIWAQHLDPTGVPQWPSEASISTQAINWVTWFSAITDGRGGLIVCWAGLGPTGSDEKVNLQRIDGSGARCWGSTGRHVYGGSGKQNPTIGGDSYHWVGLEAVPDGSGGCFIVWDDSRSDPSYDVYAQHYDSLGTPGWAVGGVALTTELGSQDHPRVVADGAGGAIVTWEDKPQNQIYAQRVDGGGTLQWGGNGIPVSNLPSAPSNPWLAADGMGGAFFTWLDRRASNADVYAQHLHAIGVPLWGAAGIPVATHGYDEMPGAILRSDAEHAIVVWTSTDSAYFGFGYDVRANRVPMDWPASVPAALGARGGLALLGVAPNPGSGALTASFMLPVAGAVRFEVLDLAGRRVRSVDAGVLAAGRHAIALGSLPGLAPGVYSLRLVQGAGSASTRLLRLR